MNRAASIFDSQMTIISAIFGGPFLSDVPTNMLSFLKVSARSMRLRCMETLMATMDDDEIREAAGEERRDDKKEMEKREKRRREKNRIDLHRRL